MTVLSFYMFYISTLSPQRYFGFDMRYAV